MSLRRRTSILDGISVETLQARLVQLQTAYLDLMSGGKGESYSYTQGDGAKTVTYTKANIADLTQAILGIQSQIDSLNGVCLGRRRAMKPYF